MRSAKILATAAALLAALTAAAPAAVDGTPPTVVFSGGPAVGKLTAGTRATVAFAADEAATFACRVDSAAYAPCVTPWSTGVLKAGTHTISVRATDTAGNAGRPARLTLTAKRR